WEWRCARGNRGVWSHSLYCRRGEVCARAWRLHDWIDVCAWFGDHGGSRTEYCSGGWARGADRIEQAQGRDRAKDGPEYDIHGDDGAARICERQPHVEPATAECEVARACCADRDGGNWG